MPVLNMPIFCGLSLDYFERHLVKKACGGKGETTDLAHYPLKPPDIEPNKASCLRHTLLQ